MSLFFNDLLKRLEMILNDIFMGNLLSVYL
jgi:hypothetical protein